MLFKPEEALLLDHLNSHTHSARALHNRSSISPIWLQGNKLLSLEYYHQLRIFRNYLFFCSFPVNFDLAILDFLVVCE